MAATASSKLLGRGSIYTLATAAPALTALLITPLLTRALPVGEYGHVATAIAVMNVGVNLLALGLPQIITRHAYSEDSGEPGARGLAMVGATLVTVLMVVVGAGLWTAHALGAASVHPALILAVVASGAGAGVAMSQALSLARNAAWTYVALAFGVSLVAPLAGLGLSYTTNKTATAYYLGVVAVYLVVVAAGLLVAWRSGPLHFTWTEFRSSVRMSLPIVPHQAAVGSAVAVAIFIARYRFGELGAAEANPSMILSSAPLIIVSALSYAWTPIVLAAKPDERGPLMTKTAADVTWLAALGGSAMALLAPWFLMFLAATKAGFDLATMVPVTAIASMTAAVAAVFLAHSQLVFTEGKTGRLMIYSPLSLLGGFLVGLTASHWLGLAGIAVGYVATYVFLWASLRMLARRATPVRWHETPLLAPIGLAVGMCLAGAWLPWTSALGIGVRLVGALGLLAVAGYRFLATLRGGRRT